MEEAQQVRQELQVQRARQEPAIPLILIRPPEVPTYLSPEQEVQKRLPTCVEGSRLIINRVESTRHVRRQDKVQLAVHRIIRRPIQGQEPILRQLIIAELPVNMPDHNLRAIQEVIPTAVIQDHRVQAVREMREDHPQEVRIKEAQVAVLHLHLTQRHQEAVLHLNRTQHLQEAAVPEVAIQAEDHLQAVVAVAEVEVAATAVADAQDNRKRFQKSNSIKIKK